MGKVFSFFIGSLLSFSAVAQTQESAQIKEDKKSGERVQIVKNVPAVYEGSSEANRIDKEYFLAYQLTGFGPTYSTTAGFLGGYYLTRQSLILLELTMGGYRGSTSWTNSDGTVSDWDVKTNSLGAHYKKFEGNSFYWKVGLDHRSVRYDYNYRPGTASTYAYGFKGKSLAFSGAIGNAWQWENFAMGCDWFGVVWPLSSSTSDEYITGSYSTFDADDFKTDKARSTSDNTIQLLRFYLGASF